ncbi:hypothetical protein [Roseovarius sp. 2305UL8-3]|uniref:hypothetical protein n=1 Tax=Roseovarius conchicola TaxID=3121636 RepID=UPI00352731BB
MRTVVTLLMISTLTLSACSAWRESRVNPSNWFGGSRSAPVETADPASTNPLLPERGNTIFRRDKRERYEGTLVAQVSDLVVERNPYGGIVRVTGVSARQGAYDVRLISETDGEPVDGVLTFSLKAVQPTDQGLGNTTTRTVRVGRFVSTAVLERTQTIRVIGATEARTTGRR